MRENPTPFTGQNLLKKLSTKRLKIERKIEGSRKVKM